MNLAIFQADEFSLNLEGARSVSPGANLGGIGFWQIVSK